MRNGHLKLAAAMLLASATFVGTAQAQIAGGSSDTGSVVVGTSNVPFGPHTAGQPGIGVPSTGLIGLVDFDGLQATAGIAPNGVTVVDQGTPQPDDHSQNGVFNFAELGTSQVYFGEWTQTGDVNDGDHTVYYVGRNPTTTAPAAATASYTVRGINDYASRGLLSGTFNATFNGSGGGSLTGSVSGGGLTVNIGTASIAGSQFTGSGASATTSAGTVSGGAVDGRFYGNNAATLAGIATFASNRQLDTAFGGTRN